MSGERRGIWHTDNAGLSGMEQRGLAGGHVLMDERRMVALSGVVVASTAGRPGKVDARVQH